MSVEVTALWTCDWCARQDRGYGDRDTTPTCWTKVGLPGVSHGARDLCHRCSIRFREALEGAERLALDYWSRQAWAAQDARKLAEAET